MTTTTTVTFLYQEKYNLRAQIFDNEPWFCLKDICDVLCVKSKELSLVQMDEKEGVKNVTPTCGDMQQQTFINEPNLYRVIFSRNGSEIQPFQHWILNQVLPAIRGKGTYLVAQRRSGEFAAQDVQNLKYLINLMTNHMQHKESWSHAIWFCLRQATSVPSPQLFAVSDLPALTNECRRIIRITSMLQNFIHAVETGMIKRVVRNGESAESFIDEMHTHFIDLLPNEAAGREKLAAFEENALNRLQSRLP